MKLGLLIFALSYSAFADTTLVIPQKLIDHHTAVCPEFGGKYGKDYTREIHALPKLQDSSSTKKLYILGCEMYAYNTMEKAYILDANNDITDVYVADIDKDLAITATSSLMGTYYDEASKTLGTFQKGRGIGDCGAASSYLYSPTYEKFILMEARIKDHCDGDVEGEWPVVYSK